MIDLTKLHLELFAKGRTILFCGAGISANSGIPNVATFLTYLLRQMGAKTKDISQFLNSGYPFEATMDNLSERFDIKALLNVFKVKNPNLNHDFIAKLAVNGLLEIIITTNFDTNIEIALKNNGLKQNQDFKVFSDFNDFKESDLKHNLVILKLHGTIENLPTILTNLKRISKRQNVLLMENVLRIVLANKKNQDILFWGYSFSDHYDIRPALLNMPRTTKQLFNLKYISKNIPVAIQDVSKLDPFKKFSRATKMNGNLDKIIGDLYKAKGYNRPPKGKSNPIWKTYIKSWITKETGPGFKDKKNFIGTLFVAAGFIELGRAYAKGNKRNTNNSKNGRILRMEIAGILGKSYLKDPNNRNVGLATKHFDDAYSIAKELKLDSYINLYSGNLGSCYLMADEFDKAELLYKDVIKFYEKKLKKDPDSSEFQDRITGYSIMLAHTLTKKGDCKSSIDIYKKTLILCDDFGLPSNKELCLAGYGIAHLYNKNYVAGLKCFTQAYPLAIQNGSIDRIKSMFLMVCSWTREVHGKARAAKFYKSEIKYIKGKTAFNKPLSNIPTKLLGSYKG